MRTLEPPEDAPRIVKLLTGPWHWRHPRVFIGMELLVSVWVVTIGIVTCAAGYWEGALCFVLAALLLSFLYVFDRTMSRSR